MTSSFPLRDINTSALFALLLSVSFAGTGLAHAGESGSAVDWSGVYLGGVVGYGSGTAKAIDGEYAAEGIHISGATGGLTLGYNRQLGNLVLGLEGDVSGASISGSGDGGDDWYCGGSEDVCTFKMDWSATLRARLGYAVGPLLPFVSAGIAVGRVSG